MTTEEKQLLLKDLCARLPYKVICNASVRNNNTDTPPISSDYCLTHSLLNYVWIDCYKLRPYLRPMKSMTKGEREEYRKLCKKVVRKLYVAYGKSWPSNKTAYLYFGTRTEYYDTYQSIDYLISRHFDYRGLIGKKLALKATKGMYK